MALVGHHCYYLKSPNTSFLIFEISSRNADALPGFLFLVTDLVENYNRTHLKNGTKICYTFEWKQENSNGNRNLTSV